MSTAPLSPVSIARPPKTKALQLSWSATIAALIAMAAVFVTAPHLVLIPFLAIMILAAHLTDIRIPNRSLIYWTIRLALIAVSLLGSVAEGNNSDTFGNERAANLLCLLSASELVLQIWRERHEWGSFVPMIGTLSGFVFLRACNTLDSTYIRFIAPVFILFLMLSLRSYRPRPMTTRPFGLAVGVALTISLGLITQQIFGYYHNQLMTMGDSLFFSMRMGDSTGMSNSPRLGETFGLRGSTKRVLRLEQYRGPEHLRGATFDGYEHANWLPAVGTGARRYDTVLKDEIEPPAASVAPDRTETRFVPMGGNVLLFAPLETTAIDLLDNTKVEWVRALHSPLYCRPQSPYIVMLPGAHSRIHSLFNLPGNEPEKAAVNLPSPRQSAGAKPVPAPVQSDPMPMKRYRQLPESFKEGQPVRALASRITAGATTPDAKVGVIVRWLLQNKKYSLTIHPKPGYDPVVDFLLNQKAAHCEYFATSAALLLRCAGVPTRYVTGYYAHETETNGDVIVRQRDAHAWAEAWIDGKGWITVDATPGDGRPDHETGGISRWQQFTEWLEDSFTNLRERISKINTDRPALIVILVSGVVLLALGVQYLRRRKQALSLEFAYSVPDAELARLARRFETLLRNQKVTLPGGQTWQENQSLLRETLGAGAEDFVALYNSVRFGRSAQADDPAFDRLRHLLTQLESKNHVRPPAP